MITIFDDFLAGELLDDYHTTEHLNHGVASSIIPVYNSASPIYVVKDALVEGLGTIIPPYCSIIIDCIQSVFKIDAPT